MKEIKLALVLCLAIWLVVQSKDYRQSYAYRNSLRQKMAINYHE